MKRVIDTQRAEQAVRMLLDALGCDPNDAGTKDTPGRVARMYAEVLGGYAMDDTCLDRVFDINTGEDDTASDDAGIVVLRDVEFHSMCEHHLLPFSGVAHVAYIPRGGRVVGLSKLARIVHVYAQRLQLQERMGRQVADAIERRLRPDGVAVVVSAKHGCMSCRGVRQPGASMVTSTVRGAFKEQHDARAELFSLLNVRGGT